MHHSLIRGLSGAIKETRTHSAGLISGHGDSGGKVSKRVTNVGRM